MHNICLGWNIRASIQGGDVAEEPFEEFLRRVVRRIERDEHIRFTPGAFSMLLTYLQEYSASGGRISEPQVDRSLGILVRDLKDEGSLFAGGRLRGEIDVRQLVTGFWLSHCRIPPFCAPRGARS